MAVAVASPQKRKQEPAHAHGASSRAAANPGGSSALRVQLRSMDYHQQIAALSPDAPVQCRGDHGTEHVHAAAAQGIAGGGGALPHADTIQAAFGRHDVSHVEAHTGSEADEATRSMGAQAYATGSHVALGSGGQDLHTTAHEAAHVVQQRGGVSLSSGVGKSGDPYEQHADRVADAVVSGQSAEGLLDEMAGGGGGGAVQSKAVQRKDEPAGKWDTARMLAKDSFFDLIRQNLLAAESWKGRAEVEDPPPLWQSALVGLGGMVLNAALGGVGGMLIKGLVAEGTKVVAELAIRTAVNAGVDACKKGVGAAQTAASGSGDQAPLIAFCEQQRLGMSAASKAARESFVKSTGDSGDQKMTIAEMEQVKAANDSQFSNAMSIQNKEMLVGWMALQAGETSKTPGTKGASTEGNVEDIDNNGILRITISGSGDSVSKIATAEVDGLNEGLRAELAGSKLGDWMVGGAHKRKQGIDVLVTTVSPDRANNFQMSQATTQKAKAADVCGTWGGFKGPIFFSIFAERTGTTSWHDSDMDLSIDSQWGADAGRWFLDNVKGHAAILNECRSKTLPTVSG